jgi:hypothetical protein
LSRKAGSRQRREKKVNSMPTEGKEDKAILFLFIGIKDAFLREIGKT